MVGASAKRQYFDIKEVRDLVITVLVLAFITSYTSFSNLLSPSFLNTFILFTFLLLFSFVTHELAHKYTAIHYDFYARFEMWRDGLIFSFIFKLLFGFTILVPGAVMVYQTYAMRKERRRKVAGIISLAGPLTNIVIASLSLLAIFLYPSLPSVVVFSLKTLAYFNSFLALFNLLPIPPLDGFKVVRWSIPIYVVSFLFSILLFSLSGM